MDLKLYTAKVISIDDTEKKGAIKIQVLPELKDVKTSDLPWAVPFISLNSTSVFSNDLPEVNSIIRVLIDKYWKRFYYLGNEFFYNIFNYDTVNTKLGDASEITNKDYKNLKFHLYKDGGLEFHNNQDGSHGFIHKSGSYSVFDSSGKIYLDSSSIELNGNTKQFVTWAELNTALTTYVTNLNLSLLTGANSGGPVVFASPPPSSIDISSAKTTTIKTG